MFKRTSLHVALAIITSLVLASCGKDDEETLSDIVSGDYTAYVSYTVGETDEIKDIKSTFSVRKQKSETVTFILRQDDQEFGEEENYFRIDNVKLSELQSSGIVFHQEVTGDFRIAGRNHGDVEAQVNGAFTPVNTRTTSSADRPKYVLECTLIFSIPQAGGTQPVFMEIYSIWE